MSNIARIDNTKMTMKRVLFDFVEQGDFCRYEEKIYMKIETVSGSYNVIDFVTGELDNIYSTCEVEIVPYSAAYEWKNYCKYCCERGILM